MTADGTAVRLLRRFRRDVIDPVGRWSRRIRNSGQVYEPVFVAGAMGSGTTLVAFELGQRFEVAGVIEESALQVSRGSFLRAGLVADFDSVAAYADRLLPDPSWSREAAVDALQALYRSYASPASSATMIDKGPNANLVRAGFLARAFPEAFFVLVFRDPVVTIEGFRRKWPLFAREPLESSISFLERIHESFLADSTAFAERVVAVSYEGLVADREGTMASLGARLGLRPAGSNRMLSERPNVPGQGIRNVEGNAIHLVQDANAKAYSRMADEDVQKIQERLGPLHARMEKMVVDGRDEGGRS